MSKSLRRSTLWGLAWFSLLTCWPLLSPQKLSPQTQELPHVLTLHSTRQAESDLEITGMVPQLAGGGAGYVTYAELARLPQVTVVVRGDENFSQSESPQGLRVTGVPLEALAHALRASAQSDLIDALCTDDYRAHYPATYIAMHHPLLGLTIKGQRPDTWAARAHAYDPSPYFVTHARFIAGAAVLAHGEQPQVPTNVVRLNFSTTAATYGAIAPRGLHAQEAQVQQGFAIARQNCLRCHAQGGFGGTKSGRSWSALATWAREQPVFFANYVRDPVAFEPHAHMPGNPRYDRATLAALTAYFQTFAPEAARRVSAVPTGSGARTR